MRGILLISHGHFAKGLKESAEMLCGACPQVFAVCLDSSDSPEVFVDKLSRAYESASVYGKVLVLCDLLGGTPCNLALQLLALLFQGSLFGLYLLGGSGQYRGGGKGNHA